MIGTFSFYWSERQRSSLTGFSEEGCLSRSVPGRRIPDYILVSCRGLSFGKSVSALLPLSKDCGENVKECRPGNAKVCMASWDRTRCVCETRMTQRQQSKLTFFQYKGHSQGHKVVDLGVIWKAFISWACMPNMKALFYGSKVMVKVIFSTDRRHPYTHRQYKN